MLNSESVTLCPPRHAEGAVFLYTALPTKQNSGKQIGTRYVPNTRPDWTIKSVKPSLFLKMIEAAHAD